MNAARPMACPGCVAVPDMAARLMPTSTDIVLQLPGIHCAACIAAVEGALTQLPGVLSARVNLTQKRALITAVPHLPVEDVVNAVLRAGYEAHEMDAATLVASGADRAGRELLLRLGVAFFAMMNVMLFSVAVWSGADDATRDMFHWISAAIALPTVLFCGQPFFRAAAASLRAGRLGMDVPISLALILATSISLFETAHSGHQAYFDAAVMLCFFLLGGRYLDHRTRALARSAAAELAALELPRALILRNGVPTLTPLSDIRAGDLLRILPGGRVAADGVVTDGQSELDRSILTGETLPQAVAPGCIISAGEMNLTGPLTMRVTAVGRESSLSRMAELVAVAERAKGAMLSLSDRAAQAYSPLVHLLSFSAFGYWMWQTGGDVRFAINIAAAVLIITCPCALGLAVPAVVTAASGKLFRLGLLLKSGTALERLAEVDTVVFDKTGTLTLGQLTAVNAGDLPAERQAVAMALAGATAHPLGCALVVALRDMGIVPAHLTEVHEVPGAGVEGLWHGQRVRLGRAEWCGADPANQTATYLCMGGHTDTIRFDDVLRPGVIPLVAALQARGMRVMVLSGDCRAAVVTLAAAVGITDWHAQMHPADKARVIDGLKAAGHKVLMVGDGLNDTNALAAAHVSVSPATAIDAARVASDMVLLGQDIAVLDRAISIARQARRRILENFAVSFGYNVVAVPLALMGLATPLAAAAAMSLSSITVSLNALRVK